MNRQEKKSTQTTAKIVIEQPTNTQYHGIEERIAKKYELN